MAWPQSVDPHARDLIALLISRNQRLGLAESCTSGLAAALLGGVPGASNVFCGSMVTYRIGSKEAWLGVPGELIDANSAESATTTGEMSLRFLDACPEADWSAAVTGHLGPGAPDEKDGRVFFSLTGRADPVRSSWNTELVLREKPRIARQIEASTRFIEWIHGRIDSISSGHPNRVG